MGGGTPEHPPPPSHTVPSFLRRQEPTRPTTDRLTPDIRRREAPRSGRREVGARSSEGGRLDSCLRRNDGKRRDRGGLKSPTDVREPRLHHLFQRRVEREHPVADFVKSLLRVVDHAVDLHAYRAV